MEDGSFVRKKIKSLTLGEKLSQLRIDRRMRVQDLSRKINVKVAYIEALEHGQYDKLPTKVYVKGFVQSYARFFGIPEKILLNLFEREYSVYQNIYNKDAEETVNKLPKVPRFVFTPRILLVVSSFILLCAVGMYLYFSIDNFISSPWLVVDAPLHNSVVNDSNVIVNGKTRNNSRVFINGQQVFVDMDGMFSDNVGLAVGANIIEIESINKFDKKSVEKINVNAEYEIHKEEKKVEEKKVHIIIKAKNEPVWINVIADEIDIYNDTLELGDERRFDANETIVLTSSSGSNTFVSFDDGETFEIVDDESEIIRDVSYTVEDVKNDDEEISE